MVNFHDPVVELSDARADGVLSTVVCGLYIWEFVTHLDYEWSVIQGNRPYRWTIWIYSVDRLATLLSVILYLVIFSTSTPINCKVWTILQYAFALPPLSSSRGGSYIRKLLALPFGTRTSTTRITAVWGPQELSCSTPNIQSNKLAITAMPVTDITLLLIMLIGLLRLRHRGGGKFDVGRLLLKQGVIYLFVATIAEITPAVFILLDVNVPFDLMFLTPSLITMSIAATHMYRSLADFGFSAN
ncbi:hypothetical protein BC827DRAFT_1383517, partial [Russula dissimulans]